VNQYQELLKDPLWQRKRLQILERDGFKCLNCGDSERTLHVHHSYYCKNRHPWDYPSWSLRTLCCDCHEEESLWTYEKRAEFFDIPLREMSMMSEMERAVDFAFSESELEGDFFYLMANIAEARKHNPKCLILLENFLIEMRKA